MELTEVTQLIRQELPLIFRTNPDMRQFILDLTRTEYADKRETTDRFDILLGEIRAIGAETRAMREEENRKWEEQKQKWEANQQELHTMREEENRKWEANQRELQTVREEQARIQEEQNQKWRENQDVINAMLQEVKQLNRKHESTIGALGSRWGLYSEGAFREALKGILVDSFGVTVEQVTLRDEQGEVFGRPDQVELDIIIKNGTLIICEIKSAASRSDVYTFWKKIKFYEAKYQRKADRRLLISPMLDKRAEKLPGELGIEVYSYADDVTGLA